MPDYPNVTASASEQAGAQRPWTDRTGPSPRLDPGTAMRLDDGGANDPTGIGLGALIGRGGPTDRSATALAAGLSFVFASASDDPLYSAVWYTVGCSIATVLGWAILMRLSTRMRGAPVSARSQRRSAVAARFLADRCWCGGGECRQLPVERQHQGLPRLLAMDNPLPGSFAFSRYAERDTRIDLSALRRIVHPWPIEPRDQNTQWYRLYKSVEVEPAVTNAHRHFLLARDYSSIAFLMLLMAGPLSVWYSAVAVPACAPCSLQPRSAPCLQPRGIGAFFRFLVTHPDMTTRTG